MKRRGRHRSCGARPLCEYHETESPSVTGNGSRQPIDWSADMLISKELNAAMNEEIGLELFASHQYLNIAAYFERLALKKLAKMFFKQADEEREHAMKFIHYVVETGGTVEVPQVAAPKPGFASVEEAIKYSLDWEIEVTNRCNAIMTIAVDQKDYAAQDFMRWFVTEQVEEVSTMQTLLQVVQSAGERNLFMLEAYLSHE
ncbi:MAG: ferritin [Acidobacteria bacterium]|nr:MAG: ferritin [Acidobacteriota bacterium]